MNTGFVLSAVEALQVSELANSKKFRPIKLSGGELVEFLPKRRGDLKVVALVAHRIQKGGVACKFDQFAGGVGANGLF